MRALIEWGPCYFGRGVAVPTPPAFCLKVDYDGDVIQVAEAEFVVGLVTAKDLLTIDCFSGSRSLAVAPGYDAELVLVGKARVLVIGDLL